MKISSSFKTTILAGIAIFSMFFGAGNVIFPLKVGLFAGHQIAYAISGLFLTAIGGPLLGLITATLYKGNCLDFFTRPGRLLGFLFISLSLLLLGPFAVIPRCFVVAYSSISAMTGGSYLTLFSIFFGAISIFCCFNQKLILPILGKIFSPLLILCLLCIIVFGLKNGSPLLETAASSKQSFQMGLQEGFDTMDLIASIFFSSSIWTLLFLKTGGKSEKEMSRIAITSGLIGGTLLGLVYLGLALATAHHAQALTGFAPEKLMPSLALLTLGPTFGNIANLAIAVACFTTVVSLSQTIADLCQKEFFPNTLSYTQFLIGILGISIVFSNLGFQKISQIIHPLIAACYPAIIALTLFNLFFKISGIKMIKRPVYGVLACSAMFRLLNLI
ncbi:MAG: Branched-chain amino acid transport system 2 carrier protein [Chlamydiae bacterium]|nr:Branched-chain amino acid transport system 2 carrier protein [Chlamydiota bacterium]